MQSQQAHDMKLCLNEADAFFDIADYCNHIDIEAQSAPILFSYDAFYFFPAIVNLTLSTELYLKALIMKCCDSYPRVHGMIELFESLPEDIRVKLELSYSNAIKYDVTLYKTLQIHENAFVKWRYAFEPQNQDVVAYFENLKIAATIIRDYISLLK